MSNLLGALRSRRDLLLHAALLVTLAACGGDGCAGCGMGPLPGGSLPADQTIEGGAQVRVTPAGIDKVEGIVGDVIEDALSGGGICIPEGSQGVGIGDIEFCFEDDGTCNNGCEAGLTIDSVNLVPVAGGLRLTAQIDAEVDVPVQLDPFIGPNIGCTLNVTASNAVITANVAFSIDPASGELGVVLQDIADLSLDPDISGCGVLGSAINFFAGLFGDFVEDLVRDELEPRLQALVAELLPDPLGIENTIDLSGFLSTLSPGTTGALEARLVPGGSVGSEAGGLSLGMIAGVNADADPASRAPELDSQAARCVPQLVAPDLAAPPFSLARTTRNTFRIPQSGPFAGQGEIPDADVVVGLSESFLDVAGHHAATSGALCLNLGTQTIPQLSLGVIGVLSQSLAKLGDNDAPVLLTAHPTQAIDFSIGDGTEESPSLTIRLHGLAIDFYAFLFQRYVRGFTVTVDLDVGVNLDFATDEDGNPTIVPELVGLDAENIGVTVTNSEFLAEPPEDIEAFLPGVLDIALPLLASALPDIALPDFLGFRLEGLRLSHVTTPSDDFLAVAATLGASPRLARLAGRVPGVERSVARLSAPAARRVVARGAARLVSVTTPPIDQIRAHLRGDGGAMPRVVIDVPARDADGRELEWSWNLGGGMWRPYRPGGRLTIETPAFALPGKYDLQLAGRVVGDYRTRSLEPAIVPVVIDSVGPDILGERAAVDGGALVVPAIDLVSSADRVRVAFGRSDDAGPATGWTDGRVPVETARSLLQGGVLRAFAEDELGNQTTELVDLRRVIIPETVPSSDGGGCAVGGDSGTGAGGLLLLGLAALLGAGGARRRLRGFARAALFLLAAGSLASMPACSCGGADVPDDDGDGSADVGDADDGEDDTTAPECTAPEECECAAGVPVCDEGECSCEDDVRWGRIGQYSELAVGPDGTAWVSAYNSYHGDLMVASRAEEGPIPDEAWQFVDGVPDGPVLVPDSEIRGGIAEPGPDVGLYTDIAVTADGAVLVSYFDQDSFSLKLATGRDGAWSSQVVATGVVGDPEEEGSTYEIAGQYSSITARADGGPGIAYFVHVRDSDGERTELRFAESNVAAPAGSGDWTVSVIDSAAVPAPTGDPLPLPMGVGLFVNAARLSDGSPVVAYYDRVAGDLELARFDPGAGAFGAPQVMDGGPIDVGWYPGLAVGADDVVHLSYVSATSSDLLYVNTADGVVEVIDDGYREVGTTEGGVPVPELHFVGDDSSVVVGPAGPMVVYQDASSHQLLVARRGEGGWAREVVAGDSDPTAGYGFYASAGMAPDGMVMSTWVIDTHTDAAWIEILFDAPPAD